MSPALPPKPSQYTRLHFDGFAGRFTVCVFEGSPGTSCPNHPASLRPSIGSCRSAILIQEMSLRHFFPNILCLRLFFTTAHLTSKTTITFLLQLSVPPWLGGPLGARTKSSGGCCFAEWWSKGYPKCNTNHKRSILGPSSVALSVRTSADA